MSFIKHPVNTIREHLTQYQMFRRGVMPPNERFNNHFTREIGKIMERYYPAAELGPHRDDWNPTVLVDQNIYRLEYRRIFSRAKRAYDTDPYARSCVRVLQSQIVGRGISPRAKPVDKDGNPLPDIGKLLDRYFERFADECFRPNRDSFYDVQSKYIANCCISGGLFLNFVPAKKDSLLPFALQQIDQSYIEFSHDNFAIPNSPMIYNGVKINDFGDPIQYFFQDLLTWVFFDMPADNMIHCYEKWHVNQWIGIPWLAPVLTTLWDLSQLQEDKLIASRIQAAIALWVKDTSSFINPKQKNTDGNINWSPGKIVKTDTKPEIIQANDNIRDSFAALIELYLRQISSGMGVSYQEMTSDLAGANFASSRTVVMDRRRYYQKKQEFVIRSFCQPIYNKFVQWCFLTGLISGKNILDFKANKWGYCRAQWTPDRWQWVDPLKDIQALVAEADRGWLSDKDYCELTGKNIDSLYQELSDEKGTKKKLGIESPLVTPVKPQSLTSELDNANEK
jgi:lambda family phage portal protein